MSAVILRPAAFAAARRAGTQPPDPICSPVVRAPTGSEDPGRPDHGERRSWHYPPPWDGVVWLPGRTPLRDQARRLRDFVGFMARAAGVAMIAGAVLTVVVTVAGGL